MGAARFTFALLLAVAMVGCGSTPTIYGSWRGTDSHGMDQVLTFDMNGVATWDLYGDGFEDRYDVPYGYLESANPSLPSAIDLGPFTSGALQGSVLYGIAKFDGAKTLILEFDPGPPNDPRYRPRQFGEDAVEFRRLE